MPEECAVSLDDLRVVPKVALTRRICALAPDRMAAACAALGDAVDC
jgi:mRNA-degrading endonuclease toxin of MazEF toxin-antitoxin module